MQPETARPATASPDAWRIPWREVWAATIRERRLVGALAVAGAAAMAVVSFLEAPRYESRAALMLASQRADVKFSGAEGNVAQADRVDEPLVNSEATWLRSEAVLREALEPWRARLDGNRPSGPLGTVLDALGLPLRLPGLAYRRLHGVPDPTPFDAWVKGVRARLVVSPVRASNVIEMSFTDTRPAFATELLSMLITYRMKRQAAFSQQDEAAGFYGEQSRLLAERVRDAEEAVQTFYAREGIVGGPDERDRLRDRLTETRGGLAQTATELAETRVRVQVLERAFRALPRQVEGPNDSGSVQGKVVELMLERSKLLARYAPTSVKIVDLDRQIDEAKRLLREERRIIAGASTATNPTVSQLEADLIRTQTQLAALEARQVALREREATDLEQIQKLVRGTSTLEQLEVDLQQAKEGLRSYVAKQEAARISSALDASAILNIIVTQAATVPLAPVPGHAGLDVVLGALGGLVLGAALAFLRDRFDPTVKSTAEVARLTRLPILGELHA